VEKLIENWTLEERLAGKNGYKKRQGSESDLAKKGDGIKETRMSS